MGRVFDEFRQIAKIPRPSFHEEKIRDYLVEWATKKGIVVRQDGFKNVYMMKPATPGYESFSSIAMQAHTDMVPQKAEGIEHDFLNDPIQFFVDGDIVSTRGRTTLGADNGLGVATILAILSDDSLEHPMLEGIFTSCEEEDFSGAENFNPDWMKSNYLMNLDHCNDYEIVVSSAGGIDFTAEKTLEYESLSGGYIDFSIKIYGFKGGHSGEDIHRGRGNTNILIFRFLDYISELDFYLSDIKGGSHRLAIPRESAVNIYLNKVDIDNFKLKAKEFNEILIEEFPDLGDEILFEINEEKSGNKAIKRDFFKNVLEYVFTSPTDIQIMSNSFPNFVDTSANLGEIFIEDEKIILVTDVRSSYESQRDFVVRKLEIIADSHNFKHKTWGAYYNWKYKKNSRLRELVFKVYEKNLDTEPKVLALHAGLECSFFDHKKENMDIVSLGPNAYDFHSPSESFSLSSLETFYKNIVEVLKEAKF